MDDMVAPKSLVAQYSPTDFINHSPVKTDKDDSEKMDCSPPLSKVVYGQVHSAAVSHSTTSYSVHAHPSIPVSQSVIRPIPIIPLDSSIYSSPPTYLDPAMVTVSLPSNQQDSGNGPHLKVSVSSPLHILPSSPTSPSSPQELLDCRWLNCNAKFSDMKELVMHVNNSHVRVERPDVDYQCKWGGCPRQGKGFNARYKMLIHIRTHTNEKPHRCTLCGKSFSRLENLKIHHRSHTGEKPYICPFEGCNKAYSNSSDRFKHVRTHTEDKPYICKMPGCDKRYTDPSSLRKHVRLHGHHSSITSKSNKTNELTLNSCGSESELSQNSSGGGLSPLPLAAGGNQTIISATFAGIGGDGLRSPVHLHGLESNPFLSSTILSMSTHTVSIHSDSLVSPVVKCLPGTPTKLEQLGEGDGKKAGRDKSFQDCPLDLTISPGSLAAQDTDLITSPNSTDGIEADEARWEIIHTIG